MVRTTELQPAPHGPADHNVVRTFRDHPDLIVLRQPDSAVAERYRSLAVKLAGGERVDRTQVVVITSAAPFEGKTLTALNIALATAESQAGPTLLIDADLRRPSLSQHLLPSAGEGLTEVLSSKIPLEQTLARIQDSNLWVLPAGRATTKPLGLLQREVLEPVFTELRRMFGQVIVDTPPAVAFSDASRLGAVADGALVVVRAGQTTKPILDRALQALHGTKLLGAVLTDTKVTPLDRYYYSYDDTDPYSYRATVRQ